VAGVVVGLAVAIVPLILASLTPGAEALSPSSAPTSDRELAGTLSPGTSDAYAAITGHAVAAVPASYEVVAVAVAIPTPLPAEGNPAELPGLVRDQTDIYVLGDTDIVSERVFDHLTSCTTGSAVRLRGREPHEIAAEVSRRRFDSADVVHVATIDDFGAVLATLDPDREPVLLVGQDSLPTATTAELMRLTPRHIVVVGDYNAISSSVESALRAYGRVLRLTGPPPPNPPATNDSEVLPKGRRAVLVTADTAHPEPEMLATAQASTGEQIVVPDGDSVPQAIAARITATTGNPCEPLPAPPTCEAGWIALTYDDGPVPERSDTVLAALKQADIRATFFPVGYLTKSHPSIVLKAANAGHVIANHTYGHEILADLPDAAISDTLDRTTAAIRAAGVEPITLVRPPGGITNHRVKNALDRAGYQQILWTTDPRDYDRKSASVIAQHVITNARDGAVVLLHDNSNNYQNTAQATITIVQALQEQGYCFGVLNDTGTITP
jgi:peptidoglycan/xylan/chitin deacetylase (PgdA/CDA1 family)